MKKNHQLNSTELSGIKGGIVYQLPILVDFYEVGVEARCASGRSNGGYVCLPGPVHRPGYEAFTYG